MNADIRRPGGRGGRLPLGRGAPALVGGYHTARREKGRQGIQKGMIHRGKGPECDEAEPGILPDLLNRLLDHRGVGESQ